MSDVIQIFIVLVLVGSWLTHVVTCLIQAKYLLLLVGVIFPPVGVIHGFGNWPGVAW